MCVRVHVRACVCSMSVLSAAYGNKDLMRDFSKYDLKRIDLYSRNMADHHMIRDLVPKCTYVLV